MHYFFQELPKDVVIRYSYNFQKVHYKRGNYIYKTGDKSTEVFLISKGEVQVTIKATQEIKLFLLSRGQIFGEVEIMKGVSRQ